MVNPCRQTCIMGKNNACMCLSPKSYCKYFTGKGGDTTIFTKAEKAAYSTLRTALLFWGEIYYGTMEVWDYELNQFNTCTVNKMINNGKQCTNV